MNKKRIDALIPKAVEVLSEVEIAEKNIISGNYKAQIAAFGAAISTGSLLAAVSSFSAQGGRQVKTDRLMYAIYRLLTGAERENDSEDRKKRLYEHVQKQQGDSTARTAVEEEVLNAAIALKLAMNLFETPGSETTE